MPRTLPFNLGRRVFNWRSIVKVYKRVATILEPVPLEHFDRIKRMLIGRFGKDLQVSKDGDYLVFNADVTGIETVEFGGK